MNWRAVRLLAREQNPGLFESPTSGLPKALRAPIDRARTAALQQAQSDYSTLPKAERDRLRKA